MNGLKIIKVHDFKGNIINTINLKEEVVLGNDRVARGSNCFYKGVGTIYNSHFIENYNENYQVLQKSNVFYLGYKVIKHNFKNKQGIFQEKYQPQFSDFIGTCGVKELALIENSELFGKSSIKVLDSVNWDKENNQYYFEVNYSCNRVKYLQNPQPKLLYELLEYMIKEGWNFPWDKTSIADISFNGLVTDVADIFYSKDNKNLLGTVYSVLYSLGKTNYNEYQNFIKSNGLLPHINNTFYIFNSIILLQKFGIDMKAFSTYSMSVQRDYFHILRNFLIEGKNCGDCCYIEIGDKIRNQYREQVDKEIYKLGTSNV
jgi:hypothetical protein